LYKQTNNYIRIYYIYQMKAQRKTLTKRAKKKGTKKRRSRRYKQRGGEETTGSTRARSLSPDPSPTAKLAEIARRGVAPDAGDAVVVAGKAGGDAEAAPDADAGGDADSVAGDAEVGAVTDAEVVDEDAVVTDAGAAAVADAEAVASITINMTPKTEDKVAAAPVAAAPVAPPPKATDVAPVVAGVTAGGTAKVAGVVDEDAGAPVAVVAGTAGGVTDAAAGEAAAAAPVAAKVKDAAAGEATDAGAGAAVDEGGEVAKVAGTAGTVAVAGAAGTVDAGAGADAVGDAKVVADEDVEADGTADGTVAADEDVEADGTADKGQKAADAGGAETKTIQFKFNYVGKEPAHQEPSDNLPTLAPKYSGARINVALQQLHNVLTEAKNDQFKPIITAITTLISEDTLTRSYILKDIEFKKTADNLVADIKRELTDVFKKRTDEYTYTFDIVEDEALQQKVEVAPATGAKDTAAKAATDAAGVASTLTNDPDGKCGDTNIAQATLIDKLTVDIVASQQAASNLQKLIDSSHETFKGILNEYKNGLNILSEKTSASNTTNIEEVDPAAPNSAPAPTPAPAPAPTPAPASKSTPASKSKPGTKPRTKPNDRGFGSSDILGGMADIFHAM
jgi:hypothetical protein